MDASWYQRLGARLARLRHDAGLTQEQLAEKAGVGASYVARIETGNRKPTLDVLGSLADALEVPIHRLLADDRELRAGEIGWTKAARALGEAVERLPAADVAHLLRLAQRLSER